LDYPELRLYDRKSISLYEMSGASVTAGVAWSGSWDFSVVSAETTGSYKVAS
jgi:hypothetical protein